MFNSMKSDFKLILLWKILFLNFEMKEYSQVKNPWEIETTEVFITTTPIKTKFYVPQVFLSIYTEHQELLQMIMKIQE